LLRNTICRSQWTIVRLTLVAEANCSVPKVWLSQWQVNLNIFATFNRDKEAVWRVSAVEIEIRLFDDVSYSAFFYCSCRLEGLRWLPSQKLRWLRMWALEISLVKNVMLMSREGWEGLLLPRWEAVSAWLRSKFWRQSKSSKSSRKASADYCGPRCSIRSGKWVRDALSNSC